MPNLITKAHRLVSIGYKSVSDVTVLDGLITSSTFFRKKDFSKAYVFRRKLFKPILFIAYQFET
jgi:hypothetical protein